MADIKLYAFVLTPGGYSYRGPATAAEALRYAAEVCRRLDWIDDSTRISGLADEADRLEAAAKGEKG